MITKTQYDICEGDTLHCSIVDGYDDSPLTSYKLKFSDVCIVRLSGAQWRFEDWISKDEEVDEDYYDLHDHLIDYLNSKLLPVLPTEVRYSFEGTVENGQLTAVYRWICSVLDEIAAENQGGKK